VLDNLYSAQVPDKFQMVLDMEEGTLAFLVEGHYLGIAHSGLRGKKLHVIVRWGSIRHFGIVRILTQMKKRISEYCSKGDFLKKLWRFRGFFTQNCT
jgi:hypothetical protein